jgi:hypothetical protein
MNGRRRLTWVTALTVASLLLGGGALNALAEGHGGGEGDSHGAQRAHPAQAAPNAQNSNKPGHQDNDNDNNNTNVQKHQDEANNNNNNVQRHDDDNEDLVTPPARVTDDDRPGLGCGDENHMHTGTPGNPDKTCKPPDAENDDQSMTTDDASAAVNVAGVTAENDDQNGD